LAAETPLFETNEVSVRYGGVSANDRVSLAVDPGRIVGLIGPNGAGKTTFIDAVSGFTPASGDVRFHGASIAQLPPHRRARLGLARTWQSGELFADLSVLENALLASQRVTLGSTLADLVLPSRRRDTDQRAWEALELVGLQQLAHSPVSELSLGQSKLLGVARALAGRPWLLLLDEPAAGLDDTESAGLGDWLRRSRRDDLGILLVDHDMALIFDVCDEVYVLDYGRIIAHGTPDAIRADESVIVAYLGERARTGADPVQRVRGAT
jgi:ABC-type branched-subunit amino acid transport system ATPase component